MVWNKNHDTNFRSLSKRKLLIELELALQCHRMQLIANFNSCHNATIWFIFEFMWKWWIYQIEMWLSSNLNANKCNWHWHIQMALCAKMCGFHFNKLRNNCTIASLVRFLTVTVFRSPKYPIKSQHQRNCIRSILPHKRKKERKTIWQYVTNQMGAFILCVALKISKRCQWLAIRDFFHLCCHSISISGCFRTWTRCWTFKFDFWFCVHCL